MKSWTYIVCGKLTFFSTCKFFHKLTSFTPVHVPSSNFHKTRNYSKEIIPTSSQLQIKKTQQTNNYKKKQLQIG